MVQAGLVTNRPDQAAAAVKSWRRMASVASERRATAPTFVLRLKPSSTARPSAARAALVEPEAQGGQVQLVQDVGGFEPGGGLEVTLGLVQFV